MPPSPLPSSPPPPRHPGVFLAVYLTILRSLILEALSNRRDASILLLSAFTFALGGAEILCDAPIHLEICSESDHATLDGEGQSRIFHLINACSLSLDGLALCNQGALQRRNSLAERKLGLTLTRACVVARMRRQGCHALVANMHSRPVPCQSQPTTRAGGRCPARCGRTPSLVALGHHRLQCGTWRRDLRDRKRRSGAVGGLDHLRVPSWSGARLSRNPLSV